MNSISKEHCLSELFSKKVSEEIQRQIAKRAQSQHAANEAKVMGAGDYPGMDGTFIDWCKEHLKEIVVGYNNEDTHELLKERFKESSYDFKYTGEGRRSWEARVYFDETEDCPNPQIIEDRDPSNPNLVSRVNLAADLYDLGFDFGKQPNYWKSISF